MAHRHRTHRRLTGRTVVALVAALLVLSAAIGASTAPAPAVTGRFPETPGLGEQVERIGADVATALADGPALVVVALNVPDTGTGAAIRTAQDSVLAAVPESSIEFVHRFHHVPAITMLLNDAAALPDLEANPAVRRIDLDVGGTGSLAQTVPLIGADDRHVLGNTGAGVLVSVLDSGADLDHPDLSGDLLGLSQRCFGWDGRAPGVGFCPDGSDSQTGIGASEDDAGHGTHVTGIVTSDGAVSSPGVAPDAEVLPLKVTDNCSFSGCFYSFTLNVVAALDYIIANPGLGVDVINMSVGTDATFVGDCDASTAWTMAGAAAINTLRANGVVSFASAGNDGSGTEMTAPACLSNVLSVGSSDDFDVVATSSNSNSKTDIFAPGVGVKSDAIGGGTTTASGTSMASPTAAGCAALLIQAGDAITPNAIETRLETSPVTVIDATNGLSFPRIWCTGVAPGGFGKVAPGDGSSGVSTGPVLSWGASSGATKYHYCYDTTNNGACSGWVNNGSGTSVGLDGLTPGTTYYWQVRARNAYGTTYADGSASADWSFTTAVEFCQGVAATVIGTDGDDALVGTDGNDVIAGLSGDDEIDGGAGNDLICGDDGKDYLVGGLGNDKLWGGAGKDRLLGGDGRDRLYGDGHHDILKGGRNRDWLWGGPGLDRLYGGPGNDEIQGQTGDDQLWGQRGDDLLNGGPGTDDADGGKHTDTCKAETVINCE